MVESRTGDCEYEGATMPKTASEHIMKLTGTKRYIESLLIVGLLTAGVVN
jgi:hypothetical protein